jgi:hypothetical protein
MSIPGSQSAMLLVLQLPPTGVTKIGAAVERLADKLALTDDERSALLPSGRYV